MDHLAFGGLGYQFETLRFPIAPMVLGAIRGALAESYFLTTMIGAQNDRTVLFTRPVAAALIALSSRSTCTGAVEGG